MRWERLFADLETELAAAEAADRDAEVAERTRIEVSRLRLRDRLRAGAEPVVVELVGAGRWQGRVVDSGPDWLVLAGDARGDVVAMLAAVRSVSGLPPWSAAPDAAPVVADRLGVGSVLRGVARDRASVTLLLRDGTPYAGTIDRVGADFVELAEHDVDQPRRAAAVRQLRLVPFAALAAVVTPPG